MPTGIYERTDFHREVLCKNLEVAHTPEARRKVRLKMLGHKTSEETREKIRIAVTGYKHSKEAKIKISEGKKGKPTNSPTKFRRGDERIIGKNNHNWKGGITPIIMQMRNSPEMKEWRKKVFQRDNYTCQGCFKRGGELNAHHKKELSEHLELAYDVDNGLTLCIDCHQKRKEFNGKREM